MACRLALSIPHNDVPEIELKYQKGEVVMEKRFCGKCGKPIGMCTCDDTISRMKKTDFSRSRSVEESGKRTGEDFRRKFNSIVLSAGEEVVRQYHIGTMKKGVFGLVDKKTGGDSYILVTNKRVISKSDCSYMGSSSTSLEEISIDNIAGVKNYYAVGMTIWKVIVGVLAISVGIALLFLGGNSYRFTDKLIKIIFAIALILLGIKMSRESKKPSYLFSIYAASVGEAMLTGANLRGKLLNSQGYGIVFQYVPTTEAVTMMRELGACIMDIKAKGDYAVEIWKK